MTKPVLSMEEELRQAVIDAMRSCGMSRVEMSRRLKISPQCIGETLLGKRKLRMDLAEAMLKQCGRGVKFTVTYYPQTRGTP